MRTAGGVRPAVAVDPHGKPHIRPPFRLTGRQRAVRPPPAAGFIISERRRKSNRRSRARLRCGERCAAARRRPVPRPIIEIVACGKVVFSFLLTISPEFSLAASPVSGMMILVGAELLLQDSF